MSGAYLRKLIDERAALTDTVTTTLDKAAAEKRDLTDDETARIEAHEARMGKLDAEITAIQTRNASAEKFLKMVGIADEEDERADRREAERRNTKQPETRKSFGATFIASTEFSEYEGRGTSKSVEFTDFIERRAAVDGAITTGDWFEALAQPQRIELTSPIAPTPFLDSIGREAVGLGAVEYVRWDMTGPEAGGPIPETDLKPQATLAPPEIVPVSLKTYAHWVPISRQSLEDLPRVQSIVETQLRDGLRRKLQNVALAAFAAATIPAAGGTGLTGIREAVGQLEALGIPAPSLVLNPLDYAALDVEAAGAANTGPTQFGSIWGLQTISAPIPQGTAYVGDLRDAVTWFDRNQYGVYLTDSHADYFIRNTLVLLAEARAEFVVTHPEAMLAVTLDSTSGGGDGGSGTSSTAGSATTGTSKAS